MSDPVTPPEASAESAGLFANVPIELTISVGRARPRISDLMKMGRNAVLPLDTRVDDPVELYVGDKLVARGALEELDEPQSGQLAVRITEIAPTGHSLG